MKILLFFVLNFIIANVYAGSGTQDEYDESYTEKSLSKDDLDSYCVERYIINTEDVVNISSCNRYEWCKVKGSNLYIKKFLFDKVSKGVYKKHNKIKGREKTYYYIRDDYSKYGYSFNAYKLCVSGEIESYTEVEEKIKFNVEEKIKFNVEEKIKFNMASSKFYPPIKPVDRTTLTPTKINRIKSTNKPKSNKVRPNKQQNSHSGVFVFAGLGSSTFNVTENNNQNLAANSLNKNGTPLELGFGFYSEDYMLTVNLQRVSLSNISFNYFYVSANYKLINYDAFTPYIGLIGGYGMGSWDKDPVVRTNFTGDLSTDAYVYGAQFGISSKFSKSFGIYGEYKYMAGPFKTNISSTEDINHSSQTPIIIGLKYYF